MTSVEWIQVAGICVAAVASIAALLQSINNHRDSMRAKRSIEENLGGAIQQIRVEINGRLSQFLREREEKGYLAGSTDAKAAGAAAHLAEELLAVARLKAAELLGVARTEALKRLGEAESTAAALDPDKRESNP